MTDPDLRHVVRTQLAWEQFPEEIVAIDLQRGVYYHLEGGGMEVFLALLAPASLAEVRARLAPRYAASEAELHAAVDAVFAALRAEELLEPTEARGAPAALPPLDGPRPLAGFRLDVHADLQELILVDPVHDTSDAGWPARRE